MEVKFPYIYHLIFILESINMNQGDYRLNYLELMRNYFLLCGPDYFCYNSNETHQWDITLEYSYKTLEVCPECHCDNECIRRGDCCPDMFFRFPELKCVNRTIIKAGNDIDREEQASTLMVTSCPLESDRKQRDKCQYLDDAKSRLLNFPVTGKTVPLTFFNKYCAECYNIVDYDFWTLDINCSQFADFNYLSTLDEVIDVAVKRECIFQAYHPYQNVENEDKSCFIPLESTTVFTKCNETGEWTNFSETVRTACESEYRKGFRMFKNVFCYMCNPSRSGITLDIVSACNLTGQWKVYDRGLERACSELPISPSTIPYKNIFCYLCNRGNDSNQQFVDINGELAEFTLRDDYFRFEYYLRVDSFNLDYFIHITNKYIKGDPELATAIFQPYSESVIRKGDNIIVNLTNILTQEASISNVRVCKARTFMFPKDYSTKCTCSLSCVFLQSGPRCCADLEIELPTACRDEFDLSNIDDFRGIKEGYLVMNGCFQEKTYSLLKEGCFRRGFEDLFSTLPISSDDTVSYNNFYCFLCNLESQDYISILNGSVKSGNYALSRRKTKESSDFLTEIVDSFLDNNKTFEIWDLHIFCPKYLDFSHLLTASELIKTAWHAKCRVRYKTETKTSSYCGTRRGGRCAGFQNWTYSDTEVEWACNNVIPYSPFYAIYFPDPIPDHLDRDRMKTYRRKYYMYSNVFCALCKPTINFTENFVDECLLTESNDSYCKIFPRTYYYYPFKNIHCALCNNMGVASVASPFPPSKIPDYDRRSDTGWFPILRNLFSISDDDVVEINIYEECEPYQVFDYSTKSCRDITCYNGKYIRGMACHPLLQITKNLRYLLEFNADVISGNASLDDVMNHIFPTVTRELETSLNVSDVIFESIFFRYIETCHGNRSIPSATCVYFRVGLFIRSSEPRLDVELALLHFRNKTLICNDNTSVIQLSQIEEYLNTSVQQEDALDFAMDKPITDYEANFFTSRVSDVLLCRQVELEDDEYNMTENSLALFLARINLTIPYGNYDITPSGKVRICYDYLVNIGYIVPFGRGRRVLDIRLKYLWIVSLICTIISMLCLALSLCVYCLFPALRTTPGKLLMTMMTSLLFTLLFLNISAFVVETYTGCVLVGIVSHICWLSVFTSMQACNFHLFKTFAGSKPSTSTSSKCFDKTILKNMVYIFGLPLLIFGTNIMIAQLTNSSSAIGYGGSKCFIDNKISIIVTFITPVALICLTNIFFLLFTIRSIHNTPNPESNQRERNELAIFFRLASITGVSWLLQVIDSFLPLSAFTFVATIVNTLQGLFIFLAFVMNKRTMGFIRQKYSRDESEITSTTSLSKRGVSNTTKSSKL